jgi:polyprenyl-phospho-N-acetylgalactosaminyl synthase
MKTFAIVPVYNENPEKLAIVLDQLKDYVNEIVVVNDGSDKYNYQRLTTNYPLLVTRYSLLTHELNRGQGAALQTGTDYAVRNGAEIIVHFDADGQHNPADIPQLIKPIEEGRADIVFGSRYLPPACPERSETEPRDPVSQPSSIVYNLHKSAQSTSSKEAVPFTKKYLLHPLARFINYLFTGLRLTDAHNGLRAFNSKIAEKIYLTQDRMAHATEYLYLVKKNNLRYLEVPVAINYHRYGQGLPGGLKIIKELFVKKIIK